MNKNLNGYLVLQRFVVKIFLNVKNIITRNFLIIQELAQDKLDELKKYKPSTENIDTVIQNMDLTLVDMSGLSLVYNGFRAASTDGELQEKEVEAIYATGKKLGLSTEQIDEVRKVFDAEMAVRKQRTAVLFPKGFNTFVTCINETKRLTNRNQMQYHFIMSN